MNLLQTFLRMIRRRRPAGGSGFPVHVASPPAPARQHANASTPRPTPKSSVPVPRSPTPPSPERLALEARAAQLQARAASGSKGCVAARRELSEVRHAILREAVRLAGV